MILKQRTQMSSPRERRLTEEGRGHGTSITDGNIYDSEKETRGQRRQESVVLKPRAVNISRGKPSKLGLMLPGSLVK